MKINSLEILIRFFIFPLATHIDLVFSLQLLSMNVPPLADPRENLTLDCKFDMGKDKLYSVKWYKDDQEFFRYTPGQRPSFRTFRVPGVYLVDKIRDCNWDHCTVQLTALTTSHSSGAYRCEVSTEAPTFRVVFETRNVTVAAVGRENPSIDGILPSYSIGDILMATCISAPADPLPTLTWLINGKQAPAYATLTPKTFQPPNSTNTPQLSLFSRSQVIKFHPERSHFSEATGTMELQCVASTPSLGPKAPSRISSVTTTLQRIELSNQKLEWPNAAGKLSSENYIFVLIFLFVLRDLMDI